MQQLYGLTKTNICHIVKVKNIEKTKVGRHNFLLRAELRTAYREHKIMENPNGFLERIDTIPTEKEHLSKDELIRLANTPCSSEVLKKAFLFSCLTGLRKSDIKQLTWDKIQPYGDGGLYVTLRMQKTKELVNNPISDEALELIGFNDEDENRKPTDRVFIGFKDSLTQTPLKNCLKAAGITKHITYHCSRHTLGSLQVEAGTSVYSTSLDTRMFPQLRSMLRWQTRASVSPSTA